MYGHVIVIIFMLQMFGKKITTGQKTTKLYMTPAIESAVNPSARTFQVVVLTVEMIQLRSSHPSGFPVSFSTEVLIVIHKIITLFPAIIVLKHAYVI